MNSLRRCRHCGVPIRLVPHRDGFKWLHDRPHAALKTHTYCHITVAEPEEIQP